MFDGNISNNGTPDDPMQGNLVFGNFIGTDEAGTLDLGNGSTGILLTSNAEFNFIGGIGAGEANIIANSKTGSGIIVDDVGTERGYGNSIRGNQIYGNFGLGIDLAGDGVSENDYTTPIFDQDDGPNRVQNFPELFSAVYDGENLTIRGQLRGRDNQNYTIDFYSSATADATGHGEAEQYVGTAFGGGVDYADTDSAGLTEFNGNAIVLNSVSVAPGEFLTATATHSDGSTSEFSMNVEIVSSNHAPVLDPSSDLILDPLFSDEFDNAGNSVADILNSDATNPSTDVDGDPQGIAVTGFDDTNGSWQYSIDGGNTWSLFSDAVPAVANDSGVVLRETDLIRFVPNSSFVGTAGNITFHAWDQSDGLAEGTTGVDVSVNGGSSAFSTASDTASIEILGSIIGRNDSFTISENSVGGVNVLDNDELNDLNTSVAPTLNFDANKDTDGNNIWEDEENRADLTLGGGVVYTTSPTNPNDGIHASFEMNGAGGINGDPVRTFISPDPTQSSASFEIWFNPTDAVGQEILFDIGNVIGTTLKVNNAQLEFHSEDFGNSITTSADISGLISGNEFIHVVGVLDMSGATTMQLYVNGVLQDTDVNAAHDDWAGSFIDGIGIGTGEGLTTVTDSPGSNRFEGEIHSFRLYESALSASSVAQNFAAATLVVSGHDSLSAEGVAVSVSADGNVTYNSGTTFDYLSAGETIVDTFSYTVTNGLGQTDTAIVSVTIVGENDAPTVSLQNTVSITENTTAQTKVADIIVSDVDMGVNDLSLSGADAGMFEIIGTELFLRANSGVDFEANSDLEVTVEVDDATIVGTPDNSVSHTFTVTDVNEAPSIDLINAVSTLPEDRDTSSRVKVADIVVTDDALGTETLVLVGPDASMFEIVGNELFLAAGETLDFESNPNLFVIVRVDDPSISNTFEDNSALSITITDVNEAPSVELANTVDTLPEDLDTSTRTKIADIVVTDDALGNNRLSDEGPDQGLFEIIGTELFLRAGVNLDFESNATLNVSVHVDDLALGEGDIVSHTITLTDVNEAPTVTLLNTVSAIDENTELLSRLKVADIQVDDDAIGSETLSLNGVDRDLFEIVGSELFLKAGSDLDFEANPVLDVTVEVDDPSLGVSFEDSAVHAINITDVNEAPSIQLTNRVTQIDENTTVQTKIADIVVTDDALGSETLAVSGGDADLFEIIGTELFLKAGQTIDFESRTVLSVTVTVDDPTLGFSNDDADSFNIDVNDVNEAPSVTLTNTVGSIDENTDTSAPIKIADIFVTDDALGNENLIVAGADAAEFEIVGSELYLRAGTTLDFESKATFDVTVEVDDPTLGATSEDFASHTLSIADVNEAPSISLANVVASLPENTDTSSAIKVADIQITDDALGSETLSVTGIDSNLFEIVGTELYLKANTDLDFESLNQLNVTISVDDTTIGSVAEDAVEFILDVLDVNEAPAVTLVNKLAAIPEDTTAQTKVADIVVSDDALGSEDLSLSGLDAARFEIIGFELFLRANPGLDFETDVDLDVSVSVDDSTVGSTPDDTDSMLIDVTDVNEAPAITLVNTITSLGENTDTSAPTKIADIQIDDDALGTNSLILDGADSALFEIVGTELFLKAGVSLDVETQNQLDVTVQVDDPTLGATFEDSEDLSITITDVNEAPSVTLVNQVASVLENTTAQTKVADIVVSDDGLGSENLSLVGSDQNYFEIIGNELFLKANQDIDFETISMLNVAVVVDDPTLGSGPEDQADFNLDVIDVNELPSVTLTNQINSLPEDFDTSGQTKIADIEIADDALGDETLFLSGADSSNFEIIGTELFLKSGIVLDFETQNMLDVTVEVDDPTLGSGSDDSTAHSVEITDVNEAPSVSLANTVDSLPEDFDTTNSTKIADIVVMDDALGSESLSLSGRDSGLFEIVGDELHLRAGVALDFESLSSLEVQVEIDDASIGTDSEDVAVHTISILDVNEAPEVVLVNKLNSVPEDTTTRTKVADIVINDDALGDETLSLTGADAGLFEIVGTELFLIANPGLDHETVPQLEVSVSVEDADINAIDIDSHTLVVTDVNEAPVVSNPLPSINATEDDPTLVIDLEDVFTDVDLDTLGLTVGSNSDPSIASILITGNSLVIDFIDDQSGSFSVDIVASDGEFTATDTLDVIVDPVNDAPVLVGDANLPTIYRDSDPAGTPIRDVVNSLFSDVDGDSLAGIAIIENAASFSEGRWQYFDTTGNSWQDIGLANQSAAVALSADTNIRFLPASNFTGVPTAIEFIAIDSTYIDSFSDSAIVHIDVSTSGATTPYSADSSELGIQVLAFGITVNPASSTTTSESGGKATFEVVLEGAPTANVIISVSSNDETEGRTSTNQLVFTPANWSQTQTVEVYGVDDVVLDGDQSYSIVLGPAVSSDVNYVSLDADDLDFVNLDDDVAGIVVSKTNLLTSENGLADDFNIALTSRPTDIVRIEISASVPGEAVLSRSFVEFTPGNWNVAQTILVEGSNDLIADGDTQFSLLITSTSVGDNNFNSVTPRSIDVTNLSVVGPIITEPEPEPVEDDDDDDDKFVGDTNTIRDEEVTLEEEVNIDDTTFIPVITRQEGANEIARESRLLDYADTGLLTEVNLLNQFTSRDFYRDVDSNEEIYEVYVEAKKLSLEAAELLRDDRDADLDDLWGELDSLDDQISQETSFVKIAAGTMASIASTLTTAFLAWQVIGGHLLVGMLARLPAWTSMDMLAVLSKAEEENEEDLESLESLVSEPDESNSQTSQNNRGAAVEKNQKTTSSYR